MMLAPLLFSSLSDELPYFQSKVIFVKITLLALTADDAAKLLQKSSLDEVQWVMSITRSIPTAASLFLGLELI